MGLVAVGVWRGDGCAGTSYELVSRSPDSEETEVKEARD